jgi:DNA-binding GntR family transcriptional regulator
MLKAINTNNISASERVYLEMRERISTAVWKPGERLVLRQLAGIFGVSNIPILEALRRLESEGLTISYPNSGAQVRSWDEDDIRGAYLAREALEGVTSRLFAEQASKTAKTKLVEYGRRFNELCRQGNLTAGRKVDVQLHLHVARNADSRPSNSNNPSSLYRLVENSHLLAATIHNACYDGSSALDIKRSEGRHDVLIEALNSGDPDLAERAGKEHVRTTMEEVMECWAKKEIEEI